ncbi:MAG TPA: type III secretion system cytoplasmic ring protein SctQ [Polyangia bacterium]|nr:type III secretion system cytoplasmic ring protein SctQ [Polyangia bacterium]
MREELEPPGAPARKRVRPFPLAELPRLTRAQVDAGRALLQHLPLEAGPEWPDVCRALGGPVELALIEAYALPARELPSQTRGTVVRLSAPGGRWALVVIDPRLAPRIARRALGTDGGPEAGELGAPRPLTVAEEGVIEFVVAALVDAQPLRVEGVVREAELPSLPAGFAGESWLLAVEARVSTPMGRGWARLLVPDTLRLHAPPPRRADSLLAHRDRLADAHVPLRLEVGRTALSRDELAALQPGDVVLFDRIGVRDARGGPITLCLGRGGFRARLDGEALTVEEPFRLNLGAPIMPSTTNEDSAPKPSEPAGEGALLRELPVEMVCELGRVTMTGRELLELRPGAVIPVGRPLAGPVDLTVGGRVVARGELVDVEGEIGVRVTQLCE